MSDIPSQVKDVAPGVCSESKGEVKKVKELKRAVIWTREGNLGLSRDFGADCNRPDFIEFTNDVLKGDTVEFRVKYFSRERSPVQYTFQGGSKHDIPKGAMFRLDHFTYSGVSGKRTFKLVRV